MRRRGVWLRLFAVVCLLGTTTLTPALARAGGAGSRGATHAARAPFRAFNLALSSRAIASQAGLLSARGVRQQTILPAAIGPYSWSIGAGPDEIYPVGNATPDPYVIVISQHYPVPISPPPGATPEPSVAGCHPIPNGYHCDTPAADRHPDTPAGGNARSSP